MSTASLMEVVPCAVCGESRTRRARVRPPVDDFRDDLDLENGRAQWVVCDGCGLVYQSPRPGPDAVAKMYLGGEYHETRGGIPDYYVRYSLRRSRDALAWGLGHPALRGRTGRALDIGAGIGGALVCLREHGWDVQGVEPDPNLAAYGREHFEVDIADGFFGPDTFPAGTTFELAYSCHVWEHLADPLAVSRAARGVLAVGGHLLIVVPTFRRSRTLAWSHFGSPHTYMFTETSLGNVLALAGFEAEAHRYVAGADSELWLLARAVDSSASHDEIRRERPEKIQRELATVPVRVPLGLPSRAASHLKTLRDDPADFAGRVGRVVRNRARRAKAALHLGS